MENKLVEDTKEAFVLTALTAGVGYIAKKAFKKSVTSDPSSSVMNFGLFTVVMVGSIYARDYLIAKKYIPT